ncbi:MAG: hypothetical protein ACOZNI_04015 [Myxococcota bacterium]
MIVAGDLPEGRARDALQRFELREIRGVGKPFEAAWGALQAYFGPRGEIERRAVIERWLRQREKREMPCRVRYHLIAAYERATGALAGARDLWVIADEDAGVCVVYLAHSLVLPEFRRNGLADLLREVAVPLGRAMAPRGELILATEQEPADPATIDTVVRLVSYGKAGFAAIPPEVLPYCQPDFRDPVEIGRTARPVPLLAVIRRVGHEGEPTLPLRLAAAFVDHLYTVFASHCRPLDLVEPLEVAYAALDEADDPVTLLPLPASTFDGEALAPLAKDGFYPHFPAIWRP